VPVLSLDHWIGLAPGIPDDVSDDDLTASEPNQSVSDLEPSRNPHVPRHTTPGRMTEVRIGQVGKSAELADAHAIRRAVFIEEQGVAEAEEMDNRDDEAWHVVAYDDGTPVGTGRLRQSDPGVAKIERVAVLRSYRDRGIGRAIMQELEDLARDRDMEGALLHAQRAVEAFYSNLGYETTSGVFDEAGIPHVEMRKTLVRDSWTC
jgi:predicted GNAT family N-acyltransferase